MKRIIAASLFLFSSGFLNFPTAFALELGEAAPPLVLAKWLKNGPVDLSEGKGKKIYIVEFWATWCPPCRSTIPHLSKLQADYAAKDLVIVGISEEDEKTVAEFIAKQSQMNYNVAIDESRKTTKAYMEDENGIPTAFVISKEGVVVWKGHPMELDSALPSIINNTFDLEKFRKISNLRKDLESSLEEGGGNIEDTTKICDQILELEPSDETALEIRLHLFGQQGKKDEALALIDRLISKCPQKPQLYFAKLSLLRNGSSIANNGDIAASVRGITETFKDNCSVLNELAWELIDGDFSKASPELAFPAAEAAVAKFPADGDKLEKAACLDTLARCYYSVGLLEQAIKYQSEALALSKEADDESRCAGVLEFYKRALKLHGEKAALQK